MREPSTTKIVLLVADGLGGLPLEPAARPNWKRPAPPTSTLCVREGVCGLTIPVLPGITPGSGPGHLGLFGYDPLQYASAAAFSKRWASTSRSGRAMSPSAATSAPWTPRGMITDRRAGRPTTERCVAMCRKLQQIKVPGVEVFVEPVREHRFVVVFRGDDLGDRVNDTDPQQVGLAPLHAVGEDAASQNTARAVNQFVAEAGQSSRTTPRPTWSRCAASPAIPRSTRCRKSTA